MSTLPVGGPAANRAGVVGSAAMHLLLLAGLLLVARGANEPAPVVYSVRLLAAPAPTQAPRRAAEAANPVPEPREVAPPEDAVVPPKPRETPPATATEATRDEQRLQTKSEVEPLPGEAPSTGTDALTFRQDGIQFQFPAYLEGIITEIRRRWVNPSGASRLTATVDFTIQRDGSVTGIRLARSSGDFTFNTEALGAVERAGREGAFGPLPAGFNGESLPIAFTFKPETK